MVDVPLSPLARRLRRAAVTVLALVVLAFILLVSPSPGVRSETPPTSGDVQAAREVWRQIEAAQAVGTAAPVRLDDRMIKGLAVLANDATELARFDAGVARGVLSTEASIGLPAGLWVNVSASATGAHQGFPAFRLQVGRLSLPDVAGRWTAGGVRSVLRLTGSTIPPLDRMVQHVRIERDGVIAQLSLPRGSAVLGSLIAGGGQGADDRQVSAIYCRLAAAQQADPATDLSHLVRRSFSPIPTPNGEEHTRAVFVALAFLLAREEAEALAPQLPHLAKHCLRPTGPILLHGREDLAKHWALSAALAAVLGKQAATNLGEWKELDDSSPAGSGFSFVDLAADRSGLQTALRALGLDTAESTLRALRGATEDDLLPRDLLQAPEGLSATEFEDRYGNIDQRDYRRAITSIDQVLARTGD